MIKVKEMEKQNTLTAVSCFNLAFMVKLYEVPCGTNPKRLLSHSPSEYNPGDSIEAPDNAELKLNKSTKW
jgi:hypothetical protein